jgi:hypothetical protein
MADHSRMSDTRQEVSPALTPPGPDMTSIEQMIQM